MNEAPPREVVIGLDVGTTSVKAVAFEPGSTWRAVAVREYPLRQPAPRQFVQDPDQILTAVAEALAECVDAISGATVLAVSVSTGMHGLMALDAGLAPLTPLVTWADARAADEARSLKRSHLADELHERTGVPVHPMSPLVKLLWFRRHDPAVWAAARWWVGLKDFILLWLTGSVVTELSSASGTGMLEMATRAWSTVALHTAGLTPRQLPPVLASTRVLPMQASSAAAVGLPAGTPIVAGAADGPLGNLATGATVPGVAGLSVGTSAAVRMVVERAGVDDHRSLFCYALTDSLWVIGGATSNGGAVARWMSTLFSVPSTCDDETHDDDMHDAALLELASTIPAGSDGLVMLPYLLPERAPLWDPDLPGAYLGVRHRHTRGHFVRAGIEGVCLQVRLLLDDVDAVAPVDSVRATGGVFRSPLWRDVMAAMLGRPLYVVDDATGTALAAAAVGLFAVGRAATLDDAVAQLRGPEGALVAPVEVDPSWVVAYDRLRANVPRLISQLGAVAAAFGDASPDP